MDDKILSLLAVDPNKVLELLNQELSLPNIPTPTLGGEVFWNDLATYEGWRLQQNMFTHHARILDPDNVRRAWGTYAGMEKAMDCVIKSFHINDVSSEEKNEAYENLKKLKELYDDGIITEEEYKEKRKKYVNKI